MSSSSRKKVSSTSKSSSSKLVHGLEAVAASLTTLFYAEQPQKPSTSKGAASTGHKQLKTTFRGSLKGVKKSSPHTVATSSSPPGATAAAIATPSTPGSTRSTRSSSIQRNVNASTPLSSSSVAFGNAVTPTYNDACHLVTPTNDDACRLVPISTTNHGFKRLNYQQIVRLCIEDEFSLVVPPNDPKQSKTANMARKATLAKIRNIILFDAPPNLDANEKEKYWSSELSNRKMMRDGKDCYEFHVKVENYAERERLEHKLPEAYVKTLIRIGAGINVQIHGTSGRKTVLLKFIRLPYLEVHIQRQHDAPFLDNSIKFPKSADDDKQMNYLVDKLFAAKGDPIAYTDILMKYYQQALKNTT